MTEALFDRLCTQFETEWQNGGRPLIEDYLGQIEEPQRDTLLAELLQIELWWRRNDPESPVADRFYERFVGLEAVVDTAFVEFNADTIKRDVSELQTSHDAFQNGPRRESSVPRELEEGSRFEFQEQLGRGAFGAVWKAHDSQLKRSVALKIPHLEPFDPAFRQRFIRESQAAARLNHDGIVSVYDVCFVENDLPVIVSQFIDGMSLAELKKQQRVFAGREAAAMCADLADALLHAHVEGVFHRDLKPANILIDASGKAYITDFGLAKDLSNEVEVTMEGDVLGTAAYMAPEQAAGKSTDVDGRCDVYAVGVILYEMVTGERPFRGTIQMLLQQVIHDAPLPPQRLNGNVQADLQTIILQCLEKKPEYRYQTAADLREDLLRYVNNEPILARPPTMLERFIKWYPSHATEMLGTYFVVAPMTWVFFIAGGLLEPETREGYQLSSLVLLPWAILWIAVGVMILKRGFWFEIANIPLLLAFMSLPLWLNDGAQSIALICFISFFGGMLQVGRFVSSRSQDEGVRAGGLVSRLSAGDSDARRSR